MDLTTIEARGAGPQWKAATAAAAVATMAGNVDPAEVSLGFTITGPIDGPSAGAILTSGLLAAMNGDSFLSDVTMTGTILPDGSIGPVGYVPTKLKAARDAGYTTVAIPASLVSVRNTEGEAVSLVDYGNEIGLTLRPVQTISEARNTRMAATTTVYPHSRGLGSETPRGCLALSSGNQHLSGELCSQLEFANDDGQMRPLRRFWP